MVASGDKKSYLAIPDFVGKGIFDLFRVDKDGKIDTTLLIPANETVVLGVSAMAESTTAPSGGIELPAGLQQFVKT